MSMTDRARLRGLFDEAAQLYDDARPSYPDVLFDDLLALTGISAGARVLEIGCGTGQASLPLARRGMRLTAVELGANLAAIAQAKLAAYPGCTVEVTPFEAWPAPAATFDLVVSATAFHWIDPAVRYARSALTLKPGGHLALWWSDSAGAPSDRGFFEAVQGVYRHVLGAATHDAVKDIHRLLPRGAGSVALPAPGDVPDRSAEITDSGLFGEVRVRRYPWAVDYDAGAYVSFLATSSGHRCLEPALRERLFREIAALIDRDFGGRITKTFVAVLSVAARL